ncbi:hypothetical protein [Tabrizicola sp.]|uniref:hypothetical protein n=1 Tax=Tabrizicola sp. TaxID=2005166 RepID=UPI003F3D8562
MHGGKVWGALAVFFQLSAPAFSEVCADRIIDSIQIDEDLYYQDICEVEGWTLRILNEGSPQNFMTSGSPRNLIELGLTPPSGVSAERYGVALVRRSRDIWEAKPVVDGELQGLDHEGGHHYFIWSPASDSYGGVILGSNADWSENSPRFFRCLSKPDHRCMTYYSVFPCGNENDPLEWGLPHHILVMAFRWEAPDNPLMISDFSKVNAYARRLTNVLHKEICSISGPDINPQN